jgi:hypothetical protein
MLKKIKVYPWLSIIELKIGMGRKSKSTLIISNRPSTSNRVANILNP